MGLQRHESGTRRSNRPPFLMPRCVNTMLGISAILLGNRAFVPPCRPPRLAAARARSALRARRVAALLRANPDCPCEEQQGAARDLGPNASAGVCNHLRRPERWAWFAHTSALHRSRGSSPRAGCGRAGRDAEAGGRCARREGAVLLGDGACEAVSQEEGGVHVAARSDAGRGARVGGDVCAAARLVSRAGVCCAAGVALAGV